MLVQSAGHYIILALALIAKPCWSTAVGADVTKNATMGPTVASPQTPVQSVQPYTHGLAGVNLSLNNVSGFALLPITALGIPHNLFYSYVLWSSMALLFIVIILIRLGQRANAHLRHLMSLHTTAEQQQYWTQDQQTYWPLIKKNLLYAPLRKKRHNREIQLSKAYNMGTIPSRLHSLLLSLYIISNIVYCALLDYHDKNRAGLFAELRGRTGHLAIVNMVGLVIFAGRNNPLIGLLRVSFDTFNLFHRWIGRIVILESIIHTIAWAVNKEWAAGPKGVSAAFWSDPFIQYGLLGTIAMSVILIQSLSVVRHAFYETFLHFHQALAIAAFVGVWFHCTLGKLPQIPFMIFILVCWSSDRFTRLARLIYHNFSFTRGVTTVRVEALPGEACRVTFYLRHPWIHRPGSHAYVYLPSISLWQSHPFSIAWAEYCAFNSPSPATKEKDGTLPHSTSDLVALTRPNAVSFLISKRTGMTAALYNRASSCPLGILNLKGAVEGPYGGLESLHSYGTVLLFAGGVGITHQLNHVRDLLAGYAQHRVATRKIILAWTVRSTEALEWVRPWMDVILAMPYRRDVLQIDMFVTKPRSQNDIISASRTVQMHAGRVKVKVVLEREFEMRVGAMCVGVCGPGALADDVRSAARGCVGEGKVDFWEEGFTW
ncbi:hypothetical protein MMC14_000677 [Varicellaria rhodocarpa]|nr:hypothetical protein [Varicellaria rhodocarpa]